MTPTQLFADLRRWLGDETAPYKWTQAELVDYYNFALDDMARETDYFKEATTSAIVHITLTAGTPDYAFDERVLEIQEARIIGETSDLVKFSMAELISQTNTWRYKDSITGTDISFASTTHTIASVTTDFTSKGFIAGDYIEVMGSTSNNETYLIESVAAHAIVVDDSFNDIPLTEVAGDQVVIKSLATGTPNKYTLDYRVGYITLVLCPDSNGVLFITGVTKQLTPLTVATISSATIPINAQYHLVMLDGIMWKAYLKSMPNTFNIEKSNAHNIAWRQAKESIKRDMIKLRAKMRTVSAHEGCI